MLEFWKLLEKGGEASRYDECLTSMVVVARAKECITEAIFAFEDDSIGEELDRIRDDLALVQKKLQERLDAEREKVRENVVQH